MDNNEQNGNRNIVGIDLSKRTMQAVRVHDSKKNQWFKPKTNEQGVRSLLNWLNINDVVVLEAGNQSFRLAKRIKNDVTCEVLVLNPGDVATIYKSLRANYNISFAGLRRRLLQIL